MSDLVLMLVVCNWRLGFATLGCWGCLVGWLFSLVWRLCDFGVGCLVSVVLVWYRFLY